LRRRDERGLAAGLSEREVAEFVEDDEVHPGQVLGDTTLPSVAGLGLQATDEVDHVVEAPSGAGALEAADLLQNVISKRVAVFMDPRRRVAPHLILGGRPTANNGGEDRPFTFAADHVVKIWVVIERHQ
jgi:hypothetical protein